MAKIDYLLQGISEEDHIEIFSDMLSFPNINKVIISVAFMRRKWISLVDDYLKPFYNITDIFVGIRNEVTSIQAILGLLKAGITPYVVDTGTTNFIFHPKIFLAYSDDEARVIIGSANATSGGFYKNIEASTIIYLDLKLKEEFEMFQKISNSIQAISIKYPANVKKVLTKEDAVQIFNEGRLADERILNRTISQLKSSVKIPENVPKMQLKEHKIVEPLVYFDDTYDNINGLLLWESTALSERDLNIPKGNNTHKTGSMTLSKGNMENIDQRHHFRDVVFHDLDWHLDNNPSKGHMERATAIFEIIVKGISYGLFNLKLTHNTKTDTATYKQNNSVTALQWGQAKNVVSRPDLLGRTLRIYKATNNYIISID